MLVKQRHLSFEETLASMLVLEHVQDTGTEFEFEDLTAIIELLVMPALAAW
jgi:hypothetical protein